MQWFGPVDDRVRAALLLLCPEKDELRQVERVRFAHGGCVVADGEGLNVAVFGPDLQDVFGVLFGFEGALELTDYDVVETRDGGGVAFFDDR